MVALLVAFEVAIGVAEGAEMAGVVKMEEVMRLLGGVVEEMVLAEAVEPL
jgi:hypothetical protein